ncbi:hypothetical protein VNO77_19405 [Canavalia gladiata]|uniref:Uncharacterized protein n=1 Tax=Canavalia gladiata TaxID=3824 RepID=A0AAN9LMN1_CANGL
MSPPPNSLKSSKCLKNSSFPSNTKIFEFFSDENSNPIDCLNGFSFLNFNPSLKTYLKVMNGNDAPPYSEASVKCKHNHETILVIFVKVDGGVMRKNSMLYSEAVFIKYWILCLFICGFFFMNGIHTPHGAIIILTFDLGFLAKPSLYCVLKSSSLLNILYSSLNIVCRILCI